MNITVSSRRVGLLLAAVIILAAVGVSVATPASAGWGTCWGAGQVCLYEDAGWQGDEYGRVSAAGFYELGGWNGDNEISSVLNNTSNCLTLYSNDGGGGRTLTVGPHSEIGTLKDYNFNDDTESYRIHSC